MKKIKSPHVAAAMRYAEGVVSGEINVCQYIKNACQRHLDDLKRVGDEDFPYHFDDERAEHAACFIEALPHTKGKWAAKQELLSLEDWQCFFVCCTFGWVDADGNRRFMYAELYVPRKNGKSQLAAAIGLYLAFADGEFGAEVYSGATSEDQAWEVFRPAKQMAERTPALQSELGVVVNASNLCNLETGSRFRPVIGKPGDGASPHCAIVDEYHEHENDDLLATMVTGMGAREQPLVLVITTAGSNMAGPCYASYLKAIKMLDGDMPNERKFTMIYTIDPDDDWTTEEALQKANPNYDVSVGGKFLRDEQLEAIKDSRLQNRFRTKHLNIWCQAREAWMNMERWRQQADPTLNEDDFAGELCIGGLDLASKHDITSYVKIFRKTIDGEDHFYPFWKHYLPEERVYERPDSYLPWMKDGYLIATEGSELDFSKVRRDIVADSRKFNIQKLGHDQHLAVQLAQELAAEGIVVVSIPQNVKYFSDPMKWIYAKTLSGRIHHDNNPVTNWMFSNVTARIDANDNIFPRKEHMDNKIDGVVAMIMAMYLAMSEPPQPMLQVIAF